MIELAGGAATAGGGLSSGGVSPSQFGGLAFDDSMVGLTVDDVCVVIVADRPVLVPLSAELSERSGFTVTAVSDETLLALGIQPRRTPVELVNVVDLVPAQDVAPTGASRPGHGLGAVARPPDEPADPGSDSWAKWPTSRSTTEAGTTEAGTFAPGRGEGLGPTASRTVTSAADPGATSFIDRRVDLPRMEVTNPPISPVPGSLISGRPVNLAEPSELVVRGEGVDETDLIIDVRDVATISLAPITLAVASASITVVSGPRGSGKTSLLRLLAGFDAPTQGGGLVGGGRLESIHPDDRAPREAISAGFIPQTPFLVPDLTVAENVELPLLATDVSPAMARGTAEETLRLVGLGSVIGLPAAILSGAEVRLAAVARALVSFPEIVFADEPFAGLSDEDATTVLACLHDVVADGGTVIIACTDPRVRLHGVRQLLLGHGRLVSDDVASATH